MLTGALSADHLVAFEHIHTLAAEHGMVIGGGQVQGVMQEGKAVLLPNYEAIDEALGKLFSEASPGTEPKYAQCAPKDIALQANYR